MDNNNLKETTLKKIKEQRVEEKFNNCEELENYLSEEGTLNFSDVIKVLRLYMVEKVPEETDQKFLDKLNVRSYINMERKAKILIDLIYSINFNGNFTSEISAMDLEMQKMFKVILAYTDIVPDTIRAYPLDFETYDLIMCSGLYDYIMSIAREDYQIFEKLIQQAFSFETFVRVSSTVGEIDPTDMNNKILEAQQFLKDFSSEDLKHLADISTLNDPLVKDIAKLIRDEKM